MTAAKPLRLAVLLSGSGTTLQNLLDRIGAGRLDARVVVVVSSRAGVKGLERAANAGIPAVVIARKDYADPAAFSAAINAVIRPYAVDLICLAGFLSLYIPDPAVCAHALNIHPALIPAFCGQGYYGRRVHEAVLAAGVKLTGATVHFVDEQYDHGPIILQAAVPVLDDDTPETLAARVKTAEDELYPRAVQLFAEGRLRIEGRRVRILPERGDG